MNQGRVASAVMGSDTSIGARTEPIDAKTIRLVTTQRDERSNRAPTLRQFKIRELQLTLAEQNESRNWAWYVTRF